jgi:hypothetical protein
VAELAHIGSIRRHRFGNVSLRERRYFREIAGMMSLAWVLRIRDSQIRCLQDRTGGLVASCGVKQQISYKHGG